MPVFALSQILCRRALRNFTPFAFNLSQIFAAIFAGNVLVLFSNALMYTLTIH